LSWSYVTGDLVQSDLALDNEDGVYCAGKDTVLYHIASSGMLTWSYAVGLDVNGYGGVCTDNERVYFQAGPFRAYNSDGTFAWSYNAASGGVTRPCVNGGKVYWGAGINRLFCWSSEGALSWSYVGAEDFVVSPAVDGLGNVYTGNNDNNFYTFTSGGTLLWSYLTGDAIKEGSEVAIWGGQTFIPSGDNNIYVFGNNTPTSTPTPTPIPSPTPT
jgi:hypothetical protein